MVQNSFFIVNIFITVIVLRRGQVSEWYIYIFTYSIHVDINAFDVSFGLQKILVRSMVYSQSLAEALSNSTEMAVFDYKISCV